MFTIILQVLQIIFTLFSTYGIIMEIKYSFFQKNQKERLFWNSFTGFLLACSATIDKNYLFVVLMVLPAMHFYSQYSKLIKEERK